MIIRIHTVLFRALQRRLTPGKYLIALLTIQTMYIVIDQVVADMSPIAIIRPVMEIEINRIDNRYKTTIPYCDIKLLLSDIYDSDRYPKLPTD